MEPLNETKNSPNAGMFPQTAETEVVEASRLAELTSSIWSRVFDKPSPKWRSHLIRRACAVYFPGTWKVSNAFVYRDH